jgi:hypothetical protein
MSLNKEVDLKVEYLKSLRPAAALDPSFPYFDEWVVPSRGAGDEGWRGKSPSGFDPKYFDAEISLPL